MSTQSELELYELCKTVYERTGWDNTHQLLVKTQQGVTEWHNNGEFEIGNADGSYPLYTSDYLLEKLLPIASIKFYLRSDGQTIIFWEPKTPYYEDMASDTPLKALLKLTLALESDRLPQ